MLVQNFTSLTPEVQLSFFQGIQRPEYILPTFDFLVKANTFPTPIQQILSMYYQVIGLYHDQTISEEFWVSSCICWSLWSLIIQS